MARTFASASSEKIDLALGGGGALSGAVTLASIVKPVVGTSWISLQIGSTANRIDLGMVGPANTLRYRRSGVAVNSTTTLTAAWTFIAVTRAAGTTTPRAHFYVYSTRTWTHENMSGTSADITPDTASALGYNPQAANQFYNGDLAVAGAWATAMTDAQVETLAFSLTPWFSYSVNGLWVLDQAATTTKVWDLTGKGANQSTITGTTVATAAVPVWNRGARPIVVASPYTVTGSAAVTLASFTSTALGGAGPSGTDTTTLASFTPSAAGGVGPSATATPTLASFSPTAAGGAGPSGISGPTLGLCSPTGSGGAGPSATCATTLGEFVSTATGSGASTPDPNPITATVRDRGHTMTIEDSGHHATAREI